MKLIIQVVFVISLCKLSSCSGHFTVIGSKYLAQDGDYTVAITSQNFNDLDVPILEVAIHDRNSNWRKAKNVTLTNGKPTNVTFNVMGEQIGAFGNYSLSIISVQGVQFNHSVNLNYISNVAVIVATDKAIYKANDTVKFRVLVLNESLKPLDETNVQIYVTDSARNWLQKFEFNDTSFSKGVHQGDFKLSDSPISGNWHIVVFVRNTKEAEKAFEVAEYTLPTFKINVNRHVNFADKSITVTLVAKYTFDEIAKGHATITAEVDGNNATKSMIPVNGKVSVDFDIEDELGLKERNRDKTVKLFVTFTDELTGKVQNSTGSIQVHVTPYKLLMRNNTTNFKPGLPFTLEAKVRYHDGKDPVTDKENAVRFVVRKIEKRICRYDRRTTGSGRRIEDVSFQKVCTGGSIFEEEIQCYPSNGTAKTETTIPENIIKVTVTVKYLDAEIPTIEFSRAKSKKNNYITITSKTEIPKLRENVRINVRSVQNFTEFSYHVLTTNGRVLLSDTIQVLPTKDHDFEFTPTDNMDTVVTVIVFYVEDDGDTVYDSLHLEFSESENFVNIQIKSNTTVAEHSTKYDINIKSQPNSFVGLLAIDQSVLSLKGGNDVSDSFDKKRYVKSNESNAFFVTYPGTGSFTFFSQSTQLGHSNHFVTIDKDNGDIEIRNKFSETWLFEGVNFDMNKTEDDIEWEVPDTITTWKIYAFSINPSSGLAITKRPTKLKVFKELFISMDLPYSIKRNEILTIPITAFNYMTNTKTSQDVLITMYNEELEFDFIDDIKNENNSTKCLTVMAKSGSSTSFRIRALKVGSIKIKVRGTSTTSDVDVIERHLLVKPEGMTEYMNKAILIHLRNVSEVENFINISIPSNVVSDSIRIKASIIGDILGLPEGSVRTLINRPGETGDQNMIHFAPNIVTLDYLTVVDKLTPGIKKELIKYLRIGYQKQLDFKLDDGSFSMWGKSDNSSSSWLTAFVAKSFRQAAKYIFVDSRVIEEAFHFLSQTQSEDGSFTDVGYIPQKDIRGNKIALTAYILITFLENADVVTTYTNTIDKSLAFISQNVDNTTDNYSLAIAAYALQLAHSGDESLKTTLLSKLQDKAIKEGDTIRWKEGDGSESRSLDIETTAYALHAFIKADCLMDSTRIMKWLVSQRNENGGFTSAQDTVVALQAMSKVAEKMYSKNIDMEVTVAYGDTASESKSFFVSEANSLMLLTEDLPASARDFKITAKGNGFSIFQISYEYKIDNTPVQEIFEINKTVHTTINSSIHRLHVCTNYTQPEKEMRPKVAVMEVEFPSGYSLHKEISDFERIELRETIKRVKYNKTSVVVYFIDLNICLNFFVINEGNVDNLQPATIRVSDYEDFYRRSEERYEITNNRQ